MTTQNSPSILLGMAFGTLLSGAVGYSIAEAAPDASGTMPLSDVKPGMKGYGLTVFSGTTPEKFDVEIISTLNNFRPDQSLILIKTPNHPRLDIAHTVAGMSGSPIYLEGKMIGAYAYGWTFGAEPIAGVTPIANMLSDLKKPIPPLFTPRKGLLPGKDQSSAPSKRVMTGLFDLKGAAQTGYDILGYDVTTHAKQLQQKAQRERGNGLSVSTLAPASTPLLLGGMNPSAMAMAESLLAPMGFVPVQAGGGGAGKIASDAPTSFVDGGAIGVQMVRGDISAMGLGTVTRVEGDKLVAFGHPMMGGGASDLPTAVAKVHWILASTNRSFKIGEPVRPMGTLVNDRQASIVVDTKRVASDFPVSLKIEGVPGAPKTEWNSHVAHDPFMAPFLTAAAIGNAIETTTAERGDTTFRAVTNLKIAGYGSIELRDFGAGAGDPMGADTFARSRFVRAMGALLNNPWEEVRIEGVETKVTVSFERNVALLRGTSLVQDELEPGQPARIKLEIVPFKGKQETRVIEVPIPASFAGDEVEIDLNPGYEVERPRAAPEKVADLVAVLNNPTFPEDAVVATIRLPRESGAAFRGNVATRLPPGAVDTLKVTAGSIGPETFGSVQQSSHPMKTFVVGRDRVRVRVRPLLK